MAVTLLCVQEEGPKGINEPLHFFISWLCAVRGYFKMMAMMLFLIMENCAAHYITHPVAKKHTIRIIHVSIKHRMVTFLFFSAYVNVSAHDSALAVGEQAKRAKALSKVCQPLLQFCAIWFLGTWLIWPCNPRAPGLRLSSIPDPCPRCWVGGPRLDTPLPLLCSHVRGG